MAISWREAYLELTNYIAGHTEVKIGADKVLLPNNIRPEFYRLFNDARKAFVEEIFPDLLNEVKILSQHYIKTEQEVTELLHLDKITIEARLERFLHNPIDKLSRELYDPLFDLLKGKTDIKKFEKLTQENIKTTFRNLFQSGYEKLIILSLLKPLKAEHLLQVTLPKFTSHDEEELLIMSSPLVEDTPLPKQTNCISFNRSNPKLALPNFIIHSAKIAKYMAFGSIISRSIATSSNVSELREWHAMDYRSSIEPGLNLIYVDDNPEEISLVADSRGIRRPDLILVCKGQKEWYGNEVLEKIKLYHINLKPTLGTYILSKDEIPEHVREELGKDGIRFIVVGFDQLKLGPVIDTLMMCYQSHTQDNQTEQNIDNREYQNMNLEL